MRETPECGLADEYSRFNRGEITATLNRNKWSKNKIPLRPAILRAVPALRQLVKRLASLHLDDHTILLNRYIMASSRGRLEE